MLHPIWPTLPRYRKAFKSKQRPQKDPSVFDNRLFVPADNAEPSITSSKVETYDEGKQEESPVESVHNNIEFEESPAEADESLKKAEESKVEQETLDSSNISELFNINYDKHLRLARHKHLLQFVNKLNDEANKQVLLSLLSML